MIEDIELIIAQSKMKLYDYNDAYELLKKIENYLKKHHLMMEEDDINDLLENNEKFYFMTQALCKKKGKEYHEDNLLRQIIRLYYIKYKISLEGFENSGNTLLPKTLVVNEERNLTKEEERVLFIKAKQGDKEAQTVILKSYFRFVYNIVKHYHNSGVEFEDLLQEGYLGIMTAIKRYDINLGYHFSTYAYHWVNQKILRFIADTKRKIRLPVHLQEKKVFYLRLLDELNRKLGRMPTDEEMAKMTGMSLNIVRALSMHIDDVVSYDKIVGNDIDLLNYIKSNDNELSKDIVRKISIKEIRKSLDESKEITDKERQILYYRFGFYDGKRYKLEELSEMYHCTKERIRQIEVRTINKIRQSRLGKILAEYYDDEEFANSRLEEYRKIICQNGRNQKIKLFDEKEDTSAKEKQARTLYELLKYYSKEHVLGAVEELSASDKKILYKYFGEDLVHKKNEKLTDKEIRRYSDILTNIRKIIVTKYHDELIEGIKEEDRQKDKTR